MDDCQTYIDALYDIANVRSCYSEACVNALKKQVNIRIQEDTQMAKIKINEQKLPQLYKSEEETNMLSKLQNTLLHRKCDSDEIGSLSRKLDNLNKALDLLNELGENDILILKAREKNRAQEKKHV